MLYRLSDGQGRVLGVFDSPEEAQGHAPEVAIWRPAAGGHPDDLDGWPADYSFHDGPHFTVRAIQEEP
ncbi:hypothetical protein [Microbispora sp. NBRC 16548]|uniref:hypothetical protein n=1 Tax=Microbispora sp. NBRC 16548 TaxID=3030994 RepID=UPI0024A1FDA7|nr:hypothetical protein [Microbispora sp. NBRC 16548]GLX06823.1 hypothetical protein Misp03_37500 [Microbispora sp. NBRC 16548]